MKPFDLKKLSEHCVELMARLGDMVSTCRMGARAFNEKKWASCSKILDEVRSIDAALDAAEQGQALSQVKHHAAAAEETRAQEELENRASECYIQGIAPELKTQETVSMTVGDDGAVIPTNIANKIVGMVKEISPLYQRATHYNVGGNLTIPSYDESIQKITVAYAMGFTAPTSASGKFTSISLSGFLVVALTKMFISLVSNSKFDIMSYVIHKVAEAVTEWIENELINGTASKIESLSKVATSVTTAAATAVTTDELIDLQESIPDALQANCIWVMSRATRKVIRKLRDADGNYLLNEDLTAKWGYGLFSRDVCISQSVSDMVASKRAVLYLGPTSLAVRVSETSNIQVLQEKFADEHAVGVTYWMEADSKVESKQKVAVLAMGTSA